MQEMRPERHMAGNSIALVGNDQKFARFYSYLE